MAVAFDSHAQLARSPDPPDWSLDPVGTLRGLLLYIVQYDNILDEINGVTAGGVPMTRLLFLQGTAGTEQGAVYVYFLGSGIPADDPITIALDVVALPTADKSGLAIGYTADTDTEVEASDVLNVDPETAPSITLVTGVGVDTAVSGALHSGTTAVGNIAAGVGYTLRTGGAGWDSGGDTGAVETKDANGTGGNVVVDFSQQSEEAHMVAVAIKESAGAAPVVVTASPATVGVSAQASSLDLGPLAIQAGPAILGVAAQEASVVPAPLVIAAEPAVVAVGAQEASPGVGAAPVVITASPAVVGVVASAVVVAERPPVFVTEGTGRATGMDRKGFARGTEGRGGLVGGFEGGGG